MISITCTDCKLTSEFFDEVRAAVTGWVNTHFNTVWLCGHCKKKHEVTRYE